MSQVLDEILQAQKRGEAVGIPSLCSAHPWVLKTALRGEAPVLIESTCNQVNQSGGYTGMTPAGFVRFVRGIAAENGFAPENILLGGDHLGPSPWQDTPVECAMSQAEDMVHAYVQAGYTKIHLDASMKLGGDDPAHPLDLELAARRTARLAKVAEAAADPTTTPRYVIGTEVPLPGGAIVPDNGAHVTTVESVRCMLEVMHAAFVEIGLEAAWENVVAVVVQPGVEFGDNFILDYNPEAARDLTLFSETTPFVYEAHSTDYQRRDILRALVRDHFAILKVGPALTFAFREAVFALAMIENELLPAEDRSCLIEILDEAMQRDPVYWKNHYHGDERMVAFSRKYSLSDRARYYWSAQIVEAALNRLLLNLDTSRIPSSLVSQFLPDIFENVCRGDTAASAAIIIRSKIIRVLDQYYLACNGVI